VTATRPRFKRLLPDGGTLDAGELLEAVPFGEHAPPERPYVVANFVSSADGRATYGGRSGKLGDDGDHDMFHTLREQVDAVLAGTGTIETEGYGRVTPDEERRARRVARGVDPEPIFVTVTRSGRVPREIPLFDVPEQRVVVFSGLPIAGWTPAAGVTVRTLTSLGDAIRALRQDHGVRSLLCEGGPHLLGALLHARLVDELFLTLAPKLTGGGGPGVSEGGELPGGPRRLTLLWALERESALYLRYALA
jgi:riboflavin biosynthesis pyrimidine reductase